MESLEADGIASRRVFYARLKYTDYIHLEHVQFLRKSAKKVLCLPLYDKLKPEGSRMNCSLAASGSK